MRRCDAQAHRGTGTGRCDGPIDKTGQCVRASQHLHTAPQTGTTMGADCSPEYVATWLPTVARETGLVDYRLAALLQETTGHTGLVVTSSGPPRHDADRCAAAAATLTPVQAKALVARARQLVAAEFPHGRCPTCGLARNPAGQCEECV
jgi:hypothetical protein